MFEYIGLGLLTIFSTVGVFVLTSILFIWIGTKLVPGPSALGLPIACLPLSGFVSLVYMVWFIQYLSHR